MDNNLNNNTTGNELPKELTEILMKSHPFKGETEERTARRRTSEERAERKMAEKAAYEEGKNATRSGVSSNAMLEAIKNRAIKENAAAKEAVKIDDTPDDATKMIDVEQVKKAREEVVAEAEEEVYIPETVREVKPAQKETSKFNNIKFDYDYDEPVQVVRHKVREKGNSVPRPAEKGEKLKSDSMFFNYAAQETFEDIVENAHVTERPKRPYPDYNKKVEYTEVKNYKKEERGEALDEFFRDNVYENYEEGDRKINYLRYAAIAAVAFIALFLFFAVRSISLSAKLGDANDQIAAYEQLQKENEDLKMQNLALTEELEGLKNAQAEEDAQAEEEAEVEEETSNANTYTVVEGDTFGAISTKVYGNFSGYKKIMEANGITDEGSLQIGQQLIIP